MCYGARKDVPSKMRPLKGFAGLGKQCALYIQSYSNSSTAGDKPKENRASTAVLAKKEFSF